MLCVARFLQHFSVQDNDSIRTQHREILRRLRDTCPCFLARQTHNILLRALLRLTLLLNARNNTLKGHAKLRK